MIEKVLFIQEFQLLIKRMIFFRQYTNTKGIIVDGFRKYKKVREDEEVENII